MTPDAPRGLLRAFAELEDPRMDRTRKHTLSDILTLATCAVICGADGWVQVQQFAECKEDWFRTFLDLPGGIPSHDTFGRVFAMLEPEAFERCFQAWVDELSRVTEGRLVAVDGKTLRRSLDAAGGQAAIHMVSAWCRANHLVLGQVATEAKSNEITAIPKLLALLDLSGAVVTLDAAGCQKKIARQIVDGGGDYVLGLKGNQGSLHAETVELFEKCLRDDCLGISWHEAETTNGGHGRIEQRRLWATGEIAWFAELSQWKGLRSLIKVEARRTIGEETSSETRYYISSLPADDPERLLDCVRGHWSVENSLHWCLDVSFADDQRRIRKGHGAENFARLSRMALNLLKGQTKHKVGIKTKRLCCGWCHEYLFRVLTQRDQGL